MDDHAGPVNHVAISSDGTKAISASDDKNVILWDLTADPPTAVPLNGHSGPVNHVAISNDGTKAISVSDDTNLILWDLTANPPTPTTLDDHTGAVNHVAISSDGKLAVSASDDRTLRVWDLTQPALVKTLNGHLDAVNHVALNVDGSSAVSASDDGTIRIWDLSVSQPRGVSLTGHNGAVRQVAVGPKMLPILSASMDSFLGSFPTNLDFYLHVWQREVTHTEDRELIEQAVEVDTATRVQTAWRVEWLPEGSEPLETKDTGARLSTDPTSATFSQNRLYRVEVHQGGIPADAAGSKGATFKYALDNGSFTTPVKDISRVNEGGADDENKLTITIDRLRSVEQMRYEGTFELIDDHVEFSGSTPKPPHRSREGSGGERA